MYEMRILLLVYHLFFAISGINASLSAATEREPITFAFLMFGILSLIASLGFLFKFSNKIVLYTLSLLLDIYVLVVLIRGHIIKPFMGFMEWILIIFIIILAVKTLRVIHKSALVLKEKKENH